MGSRRIYKVAFIIKIYGSIFEFKKWTMSARENDRDVLIQGIVDGNLSALARNVLM